MSKNDNTEDFIDESLVSEELGEETLTADRGQAMQEKLPAAKGRSAIVRIGLLFILLLAGGVGAFYFYTQMMAVDTPAGIKPAVVAAQNQDSNDTAIPPSGVPAEVVPVMSGTSLMPQVDMNMASLPPQPEPDNSAVIPAQQSSAAMSPALLDEEVPALIPGDVPLPATLAPEAPSIAPEIAPALAPSLPRDMPRVLNAAQNQETPAPSAVAPSPAELAIVQNDVILGGMQNVPIEAPNPLGAAADLPVADSPYGAASARAAIVRVLPDDFVKVSKEHEANDVDSRLTAARRALSQGRYAASLQLFNDLREDFPKDKRVLTGRAVTLQKLGQIDEALLAYEDALTQDPRNVDALSNMLGLLKKQDPALALEKLIDLRDAYPYNGDITAQLAVAYAANADYAQALKYFDIAETLTPDNPVVLYNRAVLFDKMGRGQEASSLYRKIVRLSAEGQTDMQSLPIESIKRRLLVLR